MINDRLFVDIQVASTATDIPEHSLFTSWASSTLEQAYTGDKIDNNDHDIELSIRIVDREESQTLNREYRQKDKPTNVLSFPADIPDVVETTLLGDLVICAPVVSKEAIEQEKSLLAHWAHMVIHGTLHLVGYDHIEDDEAEKMEALEIQILSSFDLPSPYIADSTSP